MAETLRGITPGFAKALAKQNLTGKKSSMGPTAVLVDLTGQISAPTETVDESVTDLEPFDLPELDATGVQRHPNGSYTDSDGIWHPAPEWWLKKYGTK